MEHEKQDCDCKKGCCCGEECACQCCGKSAYYGGYHPRWSHWGRPEKHGGNAVYGIGMVGAFIYYVQNAHTFGVVLYGLLKAVLWPGFLIFEVLKYLHM